MSIDCLEKRFLRLPQNLRARACSEAVPGQRWEGPQSSRCSIGNRAFDVSSGHLIPRTSVWGDFWSLGSSLSFLGKLHNSLLRSCSCPCFWLIRISLCWIEGKYLQRCHQRGAHWLWHLSCWVSLSQVFRNALTPKCTNVWRWRPLCKYISQAHIA